MSFRFLHRGVSALQPGGVVLFFWTLLPAGASDSSPVNSAEIVSILQKGYVKDGDVYPASANGVDELIRQAQGRIVLEPRDSAQAPTPPMTIQSVDGNLTYLRLRSFLPAQGWKDFASQAEQFLATSSGGLVIDLRSNQAPDDFPGAARLAGLFITPGTPLFTIRDAKGDSHLYSSGEKVSATERAFRGPIIVLIDHQTSGAAEALAESLQSRGAVTMGGTTSGNGALFVSQLLASGETLRYLAGNVTMADGMSLWRHAIVPDVGLVVNAKKAAAILTLLDHDRIQEVIQESAPSHRLSEAALVQGGDPELDSYLPSRIPPSLSPPQDSVLVAALDSLQAIRISHQPPTVALPSGRTAQGAPR